MARSIVVSQCINPNKYSAVGQKFGQYDLVLQTFDAEDVVPFTNFKKFSVQITDSEANINLNCGGLIFGSLITTLVSALNKFCSHAIWNYTG